MPISKNNKIIATLEDWRRLAPPKSDSHWVAGRSAMEVAKAWLEGNGQYLPAEVSSILEAHTDFGHVLGWEAEPEAKLRFDTYAGEPRNSDLAVLVRDMRGQYILAIEAKADEPYGETLGKAFAKCIERRIENRRSNGLARLESLAVSLLKPRIEGAPQAESLRYQLLTATAGALSEAKVKGLSRAVLLVHEFITDATRDENHARNASDLAAYLHRLGATSADSADTRLHGPFSTDFCPSVNLYVGKVSRSLRRVA